METGDAKWFYCLKGKVCFKTGEKEVPYASIDIQQNPYKIIDNLKKDSIWTKLELDKKYNTNLQHRLI